MAEVKKTVSVHKKKQNDVRVNKIRFFFLGCILLLAAFLRCYNLENVPPSPSLDEVSIGWNAYSILKTGNDEYGIKFPVNLRAYDDYRPAMYVYTVVPFIAAFGLRAISVRLPSVLLSVLTVLLTYYLTNLLSKNKQTGLLTLGHFAAFFLAISPWHLYISRLGHEVNLGLSLLVAGMTCFLTYQKNGKKVLLPLASILFALSFGAYQSEKIVVPLIVFTLCIYFRKEMLRKKKEYFIAFCLGFILIIPTLFATFGPNGLTRFSGTSAFSTDSFELQKERELYQKAREKRNIVDQIHYSPKLTNIRIFIANYSSHFKSAWLTTGGAKDVHKVPFTGLLYPWEFILALLGILFLVKDRSFSTLVIFSWLTLSPLPAAITTQAPHAMRALTMIPMWQVLAAIGFIRIVDLVNSRVRFICYVILGIFVLGTVPGMCSRYFDVFPRTQSESFAYAFSDALRYVKDHERQTERLRITPVFSGKSYDFQTYMFTLFTFGIDPNWYLSFGGTPRGGLGEQFVRGNLEFESLPPEQTVPGTIYIGSPKEIPSSASVLYRASFLDGKEGVVVAESRI